jgi:hypothetical protein
MRVITPTRPKAAIKPAPLAPLYSETLLLCLYAMMSWITLPATSVNRKSRPL